MVTKIGNWIIPTLEEYEALERSRSATTFKMSYMLALAVDALNEIHALGGNGGARAQLTLLAIDVLMREESGG